jgi:hypothetical protein
LPLRLYSAFVASLRDATSVKAEGTVWGRCCPERNESRSTNCAKPFPFSIVQISVHAADVKTVLRVYSIEVAAREKDDLNEDPIVVRLRKVSGPDSIL